MDRTFRTEYMFPQVVDRNRLKEITNMRFLWPEEIYRYLLKKDDEQLIRATLPLNYYEEINDKRNLSDIKKACKLMANIMPDYIPLYITKNSLDILIGLLGGNPKEESYHDHRQPEQKYVNIAKQDLAIFLSVIENLMKNGINCNELLFDNRIFSTRSGFGLLEGKSRSMTPETKPYDKYYNYHRFCTSIEYNKFFQFHDLQGFLDNVINLCQNLDYNDSMYMPNPENFDFSKYCYIKKEELNEYFGDYAACDDIIHNIINPLLEKNVGDFVNIVEYCKKVKKELYDFSIEAESKVKLNHIKYLFEDLDKCESLSEKEEIYKKLESYLSQCNETEINKINEELNIDVIKNINKNKFSKDIVQTDTKDSKKSKIKKYLAILGLGTMLGGGLCNYNNSIVEDGVIEDETIEDEISDKTENDKIIDETTEDKISDKTENDKIIDETIEDEISDKTSGIIKNLRIGKEVMQGDKHYYVSIYDKKATGVTDKGGIITRYYPLIEKENSYVSLGTLKNQDEISEFLDKHGEDALNNMIWKVSVCSGNFEELNYIIDKNLPIGSQYTTFFCDYDIEKNEVMNISR